MPLLLAEFVLDTGAARRRRQVGGVQPGVDRAVNLLDRDSVEPFVGICVVLQTHPGTEQMAELRHVEVAMKAPPAADFVMVHSQFFLALAEATLDRTATEGNSQQPTQRDALASNRIVLARYAVGQEVFHLASQHVSRHDQAMSPRR